MGSRVAVDLRSYRHMRDELEDAWVAGVAPRLGEAVLLVAPFEVEAVRRLAPEADVRAADPAAPPGKEAVAAPLDGSALYGAVRPELEGPGDEAAFAALGLPADYVLAATHPDHLHLIAAVARTDLCLVFTGPSLEGARELRDRAEELGVGHRVRLAGQPPARALPLVVRRARAVGHLVRSERFPLRALEALAAGVPLVTVTGTPAAELAGNAVPPGDVAALAGALTEPASAERIERGRRLAGGFSWERAARDLLDRAPGPSVTREPPRVSVVTPALDMARFLPETIESVLTQDYPHLDYLVMDGGSTDGTLELLRSYGDRLRYVSGPDGGQADAVNRGFRATEGALFAFLNADDTYRPGAVERAVRGFLDRPDAGVVYGDGVHVDENGRELGPYPTLDFDPGALARRCFICQPAAFMARRALDRVGLLDPRLQVALDYDLWIRLAKLHTFVRIEGILATSRMHLENKTLAQRRVLYREGTQLLKRHYDYVPLAWLHGQAQHLLQGVDQFYAHSRPGPGSRALSLAMGVRHNPRQLGRVVGEWATEAGLRDHDGRWEDGWISRRFVDEVEVPQTCRQVRVAGRHEAFLPSPLDVSLHLDGATLARTQREAHGPFVLVGDCPPAMRGRRARLEIVANGTWRPRSRGDRRRLSCLIDSVELG